MSDSDSRSTAWKHAKCLLWSHLSLFQICQSNVVYMTTYESENAQLALAKSIQASLILPSSDLQQITMHDARYWSLPKRTWAAFWRKMKLFGPVKRISKNISITVYLSVMPWFIMPLDPGFRMSSHRHALKSIIAFSASLFVCRKIFTRSRLQTLHEWTLPQSTYGIATHVMYALPWAVYLHEHVSS